MPKRKPGDEKDPGVARKKARAASAEQATQAPGVERRDAPRILSIDPSTRSRQQVEQALAPIGARCDGAATIAESRKAMSAQRYDVVIIDDQVDGGAGLQLVRELAAGDEPVRFIVLSSRSHLDAAVEAMRCGAVDFVVKPFVARELADRVTAAVGLVRRLRDNQRRMERLKRLCRRLSAARQEVSEQVDVLCNDLVSAYQELADQMSQVSLASEFSSLVRQDLDVESLLRTALEFVLQRTGPTNAAVFLPTGHAEFSLGAYVNYDVPKDTADVLLDQLADIMPQHFQEEPDILRFDDERGLQKRMGESASWLAGSTALVFSCRHDGECLAVVCLFRERKTPFPDELIPQLALMRDIFAEQLGRVVRIHHRHVDKEEWPGFDVEDDRGLAA